MTLRENIAARQAHTARLLGDRPAAKGKVALSAAKAAEALFGWVYKQPGMATLDDCKAILARVSSERGVDEALSLLHRFGVNGIGELPMCLYQRFFERAKIVLYFGVSPSFGWVDMEDVHEKRVPRDRWLLYHPESDCLWEERHTRSENSDGLVEDVSGVPKFEQRFAETGR